MELKVVRFNDPEHNKIWRDRVYHPGGSGTIDIRESRRLWPDAKIYDQDDNLIENVETYLLDVMKKFYEERRTR